MNDFFRFAFFLLCVIVVALLFLQRVRRLKRERGRLLSDGLHQARRRESEFMTRQVLEGYWEDFLSEQLRVPENKTQLTALVWFCRDYTAFRERGYQLALHCACETGRDPEWMEIARILGQLWYEGYSSGDQQMFTEKRFLEDLNKQANPD